MSRLGWLKQMRSTDGDRVGRYRRVDLADRFGPAAGLLDVLAAIALGAGLRGSEPCGAHFPDMLAKR